MSRVAAALGVSRTSLYATPKPRGPQVRAGDPELLAAIRRIVGHKPTFGYRRVTAMLRRQGWHINPKRVYRVMHHAGLLLQRFGPKPQRPHEGKVITLKSDLRWCSDAFEIRCWSAEKVYVAFSLDCCDREAISWVAADKPLDGGDIRDLMAQSIESRFGACHTPHPVQWLSDNGSIYTADETRRFARACGLLPCNTPAYSPESNGMAEAFVKTFKRDFVYLADVSTASAVMDKLDAWFETYNEEHPHKGLKMKSPRAFRRARAS